MKTPYVNELQANQPVSGTFLVSHKEVRQKKTGDPYLSLTLSDRTGEVDAKMWDNAAEVLTAFDRDDFVRVKGLLQVFQNRQQFSIHKLQPVADSEVDAGDYFPASKRDRDEMFRELQGLIAGMTNPHLKALLEAIFADEALALAFRTAPAAKSVHHAWIGGLIEHVLSMSQLAKFAAAHYPDIDADLLMAGVILHDLGKVHELTYARGFGYSDEGQLLGHIVMGVRMIDDKLRLVPGFPAPLRNLLLHMILSHHGEMEFGSPKIPLFAEALLLHHLDNLDSKMEIIRAQVERDRLLEGVWTGFNPALGRSALKKHRFLEPEAALPVSATPASPATPPVPPARHVHADPSSPFASKLRNALGDG
jgi:3'-5' exoribonuclease